MRRRKQGENVFKYAQKVWEEIVFVINKKFLVFQESKRGGGFH